MLKYIVRGQGVVELRGDLDENVVGLTGITDADGTLRVVATVPRQLADDIIAGLKLLEVVRGATRATAQPWGAVPPAPPPPLAA